MAYYLYCTTTTCTCTILKPFQNKKGQKNFQVRSFLCLFSAASCKKDTEKCAPGKFFTPSYFVTTLIYNKEDYVPGSAPHEILISTI